MGEGFREIGIKNTVSFICPKCGSRDVVVEMKERYCRFYRCDTCGYVNEDDKK